MSVLNAKKVFIEPSQEISDVIDIISATTEERVILTIPQSSRVLSSHIGLKVILRLAAENKKTIIVATEDPNGLTLAQKLGFVAVKKLSQISEALWAVAKSKESGYLQNARVFPHVEEEEVIEEIEEKALDQVVEEGGEIHLKLEEEDILKDNIKKDYEEESKEEGDKNEIEEAAEPADEEDEKFEKAAEKLIEKNSREQGPKSVQKGNIKIFLGTDVRKSPKNVRIVEDNLQSSEIEANSMSVFTGKDLTREVGAKSRSTGFFSKLFRRKKNAEDRVGAVSLAIKPPTKNSKKKWIVGAFVAVILVLLIGGYFFLASSVKTHITIEFVTNDVSVVQTIQASPDFKTINLDSFQLPAEIVTIENLSASRTAEANGTGERGNKATGLLDFYNKTDATITLPAGTKVRSVLTSLEYVLKQETVLEAKKDSQGAVAISKSDVALEAASFGTEYNITGSTTNNIFEVDGFPGTDKIEVRRVRDFTGGTKESFKSVSQANIDELKKVVIADLETQGKNRIKTSVKTGYRLIEDSIKFEEKKLTAFPELNAETKDGKFTLTIEGNVTAYILPEEDLIKMAEELVTKDNADKKVQDLSQIQISGVSRNGNIVSFNISSKGVISSDVSEDKIKQDIVGMNQAEIERYLDSSDSIKSYFVDFSPSFAPSSLKKASKNPDKIIIKIR